MDRFRNVLAVGVVLFFSIAPVFAQNIQFDSNVSPELKQQVLNDLQWMFTLEGSKATPLHQEIFGRVHGGGYAQWFSNRVHQFGVDGCGGNSAVACVTARHPDKVWVTTNYTQGNYPQVARLMTVFHEARHTEVDHGMWPHAKCPRHYPYRSIWTHSRLARKAACDSTEYGSYASASILLDNISKFCENCGAKIKADARLYADDQVKRVVGTTAIQRMKDDFAQEYQ